jgi:hypothetical protein
VARTPLSKIDIIAGRGDAAVVESCRFFEKRRQSHGRQFCDLGTTWSRFASLGFEKSRQHGSQSRGYTELAVVGGGLSIEKSISAKRTHRKNTQLFRNE